MTTPHDLETIASAAAEKAIDGFLIRLGVDVTKPLEMQRDFAHLRKWRQSVDAVSSVSLKVIVTTLVTGTLGVIYAFFTHKF